MEQNLEEAVTMMKVGEMMEKYGVKDMPYSRFRQLCEIAEQSGEEEADKILGLLGELQASKNEYKMRLKERIKKPGKDFSLADKLKLYSRRMDDMTMCLNNHFLDIINSAGREGLEVLCSHYHERLWDAWNLVVHSLAVINKRELAFMATERIGIIDELGLDGLKRIKGYIDQICDKAPDDSDSINEAIYSLCEHCVEIVKEYGWEHLEAKVKGYLRECEWNDPCTSCTRYHFLPNRKTDFPSCPPKIY